MICHRVSLYPVVYWSPTCNAGASSPPVSRLSLSAPSLWPTSTTVCGTPRLLRNAEAVSQTVPQPKVYNVTGKRSCANTAENDRLLVSIVFLPMRLACASRALGGGGLSEYTTRPSGST